VKVAVVGAGWAGLAAAVALVQRGHQVTVFEAAREPGGRARTISDRLDNGQHILIGAYRHTLQAMRTVGVEPSRVLLRQPLDLRNLQGQGLALPDLPPPWNLLVGIVRARGWQWRDRWSLLRASVRWQRSGFVCAPELSVAQLCEGLSMRVMRDLVEPLCVSALNTPPSEASAQVFLRVMRDSLQAGAGASDLLLPRTDLGALFPNAAVDWLKRAGAAVHLGSRVTQIAPATDRSHGWTTEIDGKQTTADALVLAVHAPDALRLLQTLPPSMQQQPGLIAWQAAAHALRYEPIATVYARGGPTLPAPMVALPSSDIAPAQFVFDREQLGGAAGLKAFVVSASRGTREQIEAQVLAQAQACGLGVLEPVRTVVEKRATFACTPGLARPSAAVLPGLWACADYVDGPYPSTLEGAVMSAHHVAERIAQRSVS
jgi:hydroxysqualene dehydroxylase